MKEAKTVLDFDEDTANMLGVDIKLCYTSSGHYCIPLSQKQSVINNVENAPAKDISYSQRSGYKINC